MPIRIRAAHWQLLQACTRPATTATARTFLSSASVPPRRQTPSQLRAMSSSASSAQPGPTTTQAGSPAPAASTSPLPGNTPSASPAGPAAAAAAGSSGPAGGAAPAESPSQSQSHRSHQPAVTDETPTPDGAIPTTTSTSTSTSTSDPNNQYTQPKALPALPAPDSLPSDDSQGLRTVTVNGQPIALDNLGPMVIGRDGTVSRIANWPEMTEIERQNTLRILCKRNQLRLGNLRAGLPADYKPDSGSEKPESSETSS